MAAVMDHGCSVHGHGRNLLLLDMFLPYKHVGSNGSLDLFLDQENK